MKLWRVHGELRWPREFVPASGNTAGEVSMNTLTPSYAGSETLNLSGLMASLNKMAHCGLCFPSCY